MGVMVVGRRRLNSGTHMGGIKNDKSLGQHWLKNRAILDKIAGFAAEASAEQSSDKTGVEKKNKLC